MLVSSTNFQQRVGYYLELADAGEEIFIKKLKPKGRIYKLQLAQDLNGHKTPKQMIKELQALNLESTFSSGLELQKHARN